VRKYVAKLESKNRAIEWFGGACGGKVQKRKRGLQVRQPDFSKHETAS